MLINFFFTFQTNDTFGLYDDGDIYLYSKGEIHIYVFIFCLPCL